MKDDAILLRRYADEGSEDAFTELVRRNLDLVYASALRRTNGDTHAAADVAQQVFTTLARQARKLAHHSVLSAWLHTATRNAAINHMISEQRRRLRENSAMSMEPTAMAPAEHADWERIRPVLDAAIDELPEVDRAAVILRYLERRTFGDIGAALHVSEDAARMRTERALDKLRDVLGERGITSTGAALGAIVASHTAVSAPAGLASAVAPAAMAAAAVAAGGFLSSLSMSTTLIAAGGAVAAALGVGVYVGTSLSQPDPLPVRAATPQHVQAIADLRKENLALKAEIARLNANAVPATPPPAAAAVRVTSASAPRPATAQPTFAEAQAELTRKRAVLNNLRQIHAARDQFFLEYKRPPASMDELVGETKYIRRLNAVDGEVYTGLSLQPNHPLTVTTANGVSVTYDPEGKLTTDTGPTPEMKQAMQAAHQAVLQRFGPAFVERVTAATKQATDAYRVAHGKNPKTPEALIPYFTTAQDGADFVEFAAAMKAAGL